MEDFNYKFPGVKVLVTDDYIINQKVTEAMLELLECEVDVASSGEEALEMFSDNEYDLIFMDIMMPDMDGYQATKKIRKLEKKGNKVPIVALTANASDEDERKCLKAGMDSYVAKPIKGVDLESVLHKFLEDKAETF